MTRIHGYYTYAAAVSALALPLMSAMPSAQAWPALTRPGAGSRG